MGSQGVEVVIKAIARKDGDASRDQPRIQVVNDRVRRSLGPCPQVQHHHDLAERIDHDPEPEHMRTVT